MLIWLLMQHEPTLSAVPFLKTTSWSRSSILDNVLAAGPALAFLWFYRPK